MRILFWTDPFWPCIGGVERLAVPFIRAMAGHGHQVLVITNQQKSADAQEIDLKGSQIVRLPMLEALDKRNPAELIDVQVKIGKLIRDFRPDVVHLFAAMLSAYFYARNYRKIRCPILFTEQTGWFRLETPNSLQRQVMESADWYSTCSLANARALGSLFPKTTDTMSVIMNGIDLSREYTYSDPPTDPPILLCMGRHQLSQKGFDLAVAAMPAILRRFPRAKLLIAGDGQDRKHLESMVVEMGLSANIEFVGWVHPDRVQALISQVTLMIVPSRFDPFGLVAAETGAAFRPCVASNVGGLAEIIENGRTGRLVKPEDPAAIAEAVCELLAKPQALGTIGKAAHERVSRLFRFERFVQEYEELYEKLVKSFPSRTHDR
jgi:glycosyltransferase involved in cell wall biosynthesis